jgi:uncharacterized protein (TIGR02453 family)
MAMPDTSVFGSDIFTFLRRLKRNNNREWFAKNKARYQKSIVEPALSFIGGFAPQLEKISPFFVADARPTRGSLFRIYRDTRFASDKRPFKTHVGLHFSHPAARMPMHQFSISTLSRAIVSPRQVSGIQITRL